MAHGQSGSSSPEDFMWYTNNWSYLLTTKSCDWLRQHAIRDMHCEVLESRLKRMNIKWVEYTDPGGGGLFVIETCDNNEIDLVLRFDDSASRWVCTVECDDSTQFTHKQHHAIDMLTTPWLPGNPFETNNARGSLAGDGAGPGGTGFARLRQSHLRMRTRPTRDRSRSR